MDKKLTAAISFLRNDWKERVLEDYEQERDEYGLLGIKLLQKEGRHAVWGTCKLLGADSYGVAGRACRLLERYLHTHVNNFCKTNDDLEERTSFKEALLSRLPLLMASCAQLSAKMSSTSAEMNAGFVRARLASVRLDFSVQEINSSEFQVFSTLQFHVPLWTCVEVGQMLALEVGLPWRQLDAVAVVVNAAEFARDSIDTRLRDIADSSPQSSTSSTLGPTAALQSLHLVAGALAACARVLAPNAPDLAPRLAELTRAPPALLRCVADVIITDVLADTDSPECPRKAKRRKLF